MISRELLHEAAWRDCGPVCVSIPRREYGVLVIPLLNCLLSVRLYVEIKGPAERKTTKSCLGRVRKQQGATSALSTQKSPLAESLRTAVPGASPRLGDRRPRQRWKMLVWLSSDPATSTRTPYNHEGHTKAHIKSTPSVHQDHVSREKNRTAF